MEDMMPAGSLSQDHIQMWETVNRSGIVITVDDKAGALAKTLNILAKHDISLT